MLPEEQPFASIVFIKDYQSYGLENKGDLGVGPR